LRHLPQPTLWTNVVFNHAATGWALTGSQSLAPAGKVVACMDCHKGNNYTFTAANTGPATAATRRPGIARRRSAALCRTTLAQVSGDGIRMRDLSPDSPNGRTASLTTLRLVSR